MRLPDAPPHRRSQRDKPVGSAAPSQDRGASLPAVPADIPAKENLTPLMKQYEALKSRHPGEILFFRLGDFFEMFGEDAREAAPILEVALTRRQGTPMCGVPFHSVDRYVAKLLKAGRRVAIAEQTEDPAAALPEAPAGHDGRTGRAAKGIVRREVVRVVSPGTILEENLLNERSNNFLAGLALEKPAGEAAEAKAGLAALDVSTGECSLVELSAGRDGSGLKSELHRVAPAELLLLEKDKDWAPLLGEIPCRLIQPADLEEAPCEETIAEGSPLARRAMAMILAYVRRMHPASLNQIQPPQLLDPRRTMPLDPETIENLELLRNSTDGGARSTLYAFLDETVTPMGGRLLKQWLIRPLLDLQTIRERAGAVEHLLQNSSLRRRLREHLKGVSDLERIIMRVGSRRAAPPDLLALKNSLLQVENIRELLASQNGSGFDDSLPAALSSLAARLERWGGITELLGRAIAEEPPVQLSQGGAIRTGYNAALDEKRRASHEGKVWLQELEKREREKTKIPTLRIGYTSVFGYYFEVTRPHIPKVPSDWHRKQTLVNSERFLNDELKTLEQQILGAEEQSLRIERELFAQLVETLAESAARVQKAARSAAELDCLLSFSETAERKGLVRPVVDDSDILLIRDGWHPVVQEALPPGLFVPNDADLDEEGRVVILTGPNMSGKSTYLRQVALIALLAQTGSFVPAKSARIGLVDKIFTRIGSGDRLAQGQSTFMVEMSETARIFRQATRRSLIILDEVGRGTSTYDGISIAWAVLDHLAKRIRPKVIFATHFFELTHLASQLPGVKNCNVQAKEWKDSVVFLHKVADGPADRSYGIHVAQLAGLPPEVIQNARKILEKFQGEHGSLLKIEKNLQPELF